MWLGVSGLSAAWGARQARPRRALRVALGVARSALPRLTCACLGTALVAAGPVPTPVPTPSTANQAGTAGAAEAAGSASPAAGVSLELVESGPNARWKLRLVNRSGAAVSLAADVRLLSLAVRPPGSLRTTQCRLPKAMQPLRFARRSIVRLEAGAAHEVQFDPRLFCFSGVLQTLLIPGSQVLPRFGRDQAPDSGARAVVWPAASEGEGKGWRRREMRASRQAPSHPMLEGAPLTLGQAYRSWEVRTLARPLHDARQAEAKPGSAERVAYPDSPLGLLMLRGADARNEREILLTLGLENRTGSTERLFLRPEFWTLTVVGPDGPFTCKSTLDLAASSAAAFERLQAGSTRRVVLRPVEICPPQSFDRPGLYRVHASLEASDSGARFGLEGFVGHLETAQPALVRVHRGQRPFFLRRNRTRSDAAPQARPRPPARPPAEAASPARSLEAPMPLRLPPPDATPDIAALPGFPANRD